MIGRKSQLCAAIFFATLGLSLSVRAETNAEWGGAPDGAAWAQSARDAIKSDGSELISAQPRDIATFCSNYASLGAEDRQTFWANFLSALAQAESKNDPSKTRWHLYNADAGRPVFSRGLFQISIESAHRKIYQCEVAHARDLTQPSDNIACAVRILNHWVATDGAVADHSASGWRGGARYWRSLRRSDKRSSIAAATSQQPACVAK